jgi:competence protein ComGC
MKKWMGLVVIFLLVSAAVLYFFVFTKKKEEKPVEQENAAVSTVSKQSEAFNLSVENLLNAYYAMNEGFVNWDTAAVKKNSLAFKNTLDSFKLNDLKIDSASLESVERSLNAVKSETAAIVEDDKLDEQRGSLNILSQALYDFISKIKYDRSKIYYQECPMAFDDVNPGNWLSAQKEIRNPYLGTSHPKYKSGMLKCGSTKEVINYTGNVSAEK